MRIGRHAAIRVGAVAMAFMAAGGEASAQGYPFRPIRLVVGFAPGGSTDIAARLIGQWLTERLGKQVVIDNRPGTVSNIAAETVARAAPDGHTLLLISSADAINATLHPRPGFVFLREIEPVAGFTQQPQAMMANPAVAARTLGELIALAKASPGTITIASAGNGSISHLAGELLRMSAGIDLIHLPYRGSGPALTDLLAGHVQISFSGLAGAIQHFKSGRLRALAVTTARRSEALPDVPTVGEHLPGFEAVSFFGIGTTKGTTAEIVATLSRELNAALVEPRIVARLAELGGMPLPGAPADFARLIAAETEKWGKVIRAANIKAE